MQDLNLRFHFITFYDRNYSRSGTLMSGLRELGEMTSFSVVSGGLFKRFRQILSIVANREKNTVFVVMSPSHLLTIYLKLARANKVILDAGWSLTEAEFSRGAISRIPRLLKALLVDYFSFLFADLILVESKAEANYLSSKCERLREKIIVTYTGVTESKLKIAPVCPEEMKEVSHFSKFIVFRGKINNEAGFQRILDIGSALQKSEFLLVVASPNKDISEIKSENVLLINRWISQSEINYLYHNSVLVIGQLGSIPRLDRTIPHKYFEAIYFGRPYISELTKSIEEISKGGKGVIELRMQPEQNLAIEIFSILNDNALLIQKGNEARQIWESGISSKGIARKLISEEKFKLLIY